MFDDDDGFDHLFSGGSPREKFYEILHHANKDLVLQELDSVFARMAALEAMVGESEENEKQIRSWIMQNDEAVHDALTGHYLGITAAIVSQNG